MKILIYGGGAREHALAWKIRQSPLLDKLFLCRPNDGFAELGEVINAQNYEQLAQTSAEKGIDLLVVGPEDPLIGGIVDEFRKKGIPAIGPGKEWAMLEGSKSFAKEFMLRNSISTGKYEVVTAENDISNVLDRFGEPVVLKADGLAAGKGVYIAKTRQDAEATLTQFLEGKFGESSKKVVIEEFLQGREISLIALWDGRTLLPFIPARDYKKLLDGDNGPNTGGMGAYCPVSLTVDEYNELEIYIKTLEKALKNEQADFAGVVYSGLILTEHGLKVLEYNMRFGDPETQPLLMHLESDLVELFKMAVNKSLDRAELKWKKGQSYCVVAAAAGYPENPKKGAQIKNIGQVEQNHDVTIFLAGVKKEGENLLANGGRVLSVCHTGPYAREHIYSALEELDFSDKIYRRDIHETGCNNCRLGERQGFC